MADTAAGTEPTEHTELKRAIGPKLLLFFVIGDILGTGIYALTGSVAGRIGGALWLPFLLAFAVAFITAFSYLELVGKYPRAAGAALYTHKAFGINFLTFMVTFTVMASGVTSAATAAVAFGETYLRQFVELPTWAVAGVFILLLGLINFRGVGESVKANVVLTCIELSGLLLIIGVGIYAVGGGEGDASRLTQINTGDTGAFLAITAATSLAFFAMVGFEDSVNMAEECRDPVRIFPRAMLLGMGVAAAIYVVVAVLSSVLVPAEELADAGSAALFRVLEAGAPGFPLPVFAAIGLFAVVNSALINMLMASRLLYGMANERIIPRPFAFVHPERRTPWVAIVFTSVDRDDPRDQREHHGTGRYHGAAAARSLHDRQHRRPRPAPARPQRPPALPRPLVDAVPGDRAVRVPGHPAVRSAVAAVRGGWDPAGGRCPPVGGQPARRRAGRRGPDPPDQGVTPEWL